MEKSNFPEIMIITGMSGAGKSRAIEVFEDMGYNCVDNMPPSLIAKFVEICCGPGANFNQLCIVVDCRVGELFDSLDAALSSLRDVGCHYRILFLDATDDVLKCRYKETRRRHPLVGLAGGDISKAISMERKMLQRAKMGADVVIDTSLSSAKTLKELIIKKFGNRNQSLSVTVMSFGFKYGPQSDADMLFDVRCLPNPYYIENLRSLTGLDDEVFHYVFQWDESQKMLDKFSDLITFSLPLFAREGRSSLTIAFGCTGGQHRSVSFARQIGENIMEMGYNTIVVHRDIDK